MPEPRRIARLQQLILEVAAEHLQQRMADPRLRLVTLTRVKLAPDLSEAVVYYSTLAEGDERRAAARALSRATPLVQSVVGREIATRTTPRLSFRFDATIASAARLETIFERLRRERGEGPADAPPAAEATGEGPDDDDDGADADDDEADDEGRDGAADGAGPAGAGDGEARADADDAAPPDAGVGPGPGRR